MALQLKRAGVKHVRPLQGGFEAWQRLNLPVETAELPTDQLTPEKDAHNRLAERG